MLITEAFAQAAQAPGPQGGGGSLLSSPLFPLLMTLPILYFLIIRPQNKRMKEHRELLANVRRGDTVVTGGGILGKIVKVEDSEVQVEIADGVRIKVLKSTITEVRTKGEPVPAKADDKTETKA